MLMIPGRTKEGLINPKVNEIIEKMEKELTSVIEDFMRAVDVEALHLAKKSGTYSLCRPGK